MNEGNETQIEYLRHRNIEDALTVIRHRNAQCEYQQDRIEALEAAIRKHRDTGLDDGSDQGELDEYLWSILEDKTMNDKDTKNVNIYSGLTRREAFAMHAMSAINKQNEYLSDMGLPTPAEIAETLKADFTVAQAETIAAEIYQPIRNLLTRILLDK